ncbi:MAG: hypothetical protein WCJ76_13245, partial [Comamonadaceae bacterium]
TKTYTTDGIAYGSNAATVGYALNAALGNAGSVEVTSSTKGDYLVTFGGALSSTDVGTLVATPVTEAPSGSFKLTFGSETTQTISYSSDGATLARRVQTALAKLTAIGSGNVQVNYNAGQSNESLVGLDIRFTGTLASTNVSQITIEQTNLVNASGVVRTVTGGVANINQVQSMTLGTDAVANGYRLSLTYLGETYTTNLISGNATASAIQSAVNSVFGVINGAAFTVGKSDTTVTLTVGGSLSGENLNLVNLQAEGAASSGSTVTKSFVVSNVTGNVANLKAAFAELLTTDPANISVTYDSSYKAGERYVVSFVGALAGTNVADKGISVDGTSVAWKLLSDGTAAVREGQKVVVDRATTTQGDFQLSLTQGGKTYTTVNIALGSDAATVQSALQNAKASDNTLLSSLGTITVAGAADAYAVTFGGLLAGTNVAELKLAALSVDQELPTGSFEISLDGIKTSSITYSADKAVMAGSIQTVLEGLSSIGAGNVTVTLDTANSTGRNAAFLVTFKGGHAFENIPNITSHFAGMSLAVVSPKNIAQGEAQSGEVQRIVATSESTDLAYTLSLTHGSKSATGATLESGMSEVEVQGVLDTMMMSLNTAIGGGFAATATVEFWSGKELQVRFGGSLIGVDVAAMTATNVARSYPTAITVAQAGSTTEIAARPIRTLVVDYSLKEGSTTERKTALSVVTGPTTTMELTMDGAKGKLLQASGALTLDVYGFFAVQGNLAIEKSTSSVTLNDSVVAADGTVTKPASQVTVDLLTIGGSKLSAFAGLNGGFDDAGQLKAGALGLSLSDTEFGLALIGQQRTGLEPVGTVLRKWTSLQANVGSVGFVGVADLTISADTLSVEINRAATDGTLVDYKAQSLAINTGTTADPSTMSLSMDGSEGALLRATGNLELDLFGFVQVSGGFGIEKKSGSVTLADVASTTTVNESSTPVGVDMLLIGGSGLDAFIGAGGVGLELGDVNVGLALLGEQLTEAQVTAGKVARKWTTIQAEVGSAALVGVDGLSVGVETLSVSVNRQALDTSVVDYSLKAVSTTDRKTDLTILTGPASDMALTIDGGRGQFLEASGHLMLDVFGFVQVDGEFAIEKASTPETISLSDATTVNAEVLRIGASNLSAFAGMNGGTDEAIGLDLSGVEFGLALMTEVPA